MTWIRDRSRVFRLESVVGWQWENVGTGGMPVMVLTVWLPGHALSFYKPDADEIELLLFAAGGPAIDPLVTPPDADADELRRALTTPKRTES